MRFDAINLADLAPPPVVEPLDFETVLAEIKADAVARLEAVGIAYNVENLESDPVVKVLEVVAYREIALRARVNDASRAIMLAFSTSGDLDHLAVYYGTQRLGSELDDPYRERVQLAPEALSVAGPVGAYVYHARKVSADVADVGVHKPAAGQIQLYVLTLSGTGVPSTTLLETIAARFRDETLVPFTDNVSVRPCTLVPFALVASLEMGRGPDPNLLKAKALAAVQTYIAKRRRVGQRITMSGLSAALTVGGIDKVTLTSPNADIEPGYSGVAVATVITLTTQVTA